MDFPHPIICGDSWGMSITRELNLLFVKGLCFLRVFFLSQVVIRDVKKEVKFDSTCYRETRW